jgi:hypothetical protein
LVLRFIALLHRARRTWILQFVLRAWTEGWNLMKVLWCDRDLFNRILRSLVENIWRWPLSSIAINTFSFIAHLHQLHSVVVARC